MSSATQNGFVRDAWQTPRNARTLRAMMALQNHDIAERIRELREARGGVPQTRVAAELGVSERTYQTWELGEAKPSYSSLEKLAKYYKVPAEYILTGAEHAQPEPPIVVTEHVSAGFEEFRGYVRELSAKLDLLLKHFRIEVATPDVVAGEMEQAAAGARQDAPSTPAENASKPVAIPQSR